MIIGADHVELMTPVEIKCDEQNLNSLIGVRTHLGWSVIGPESDIDLYEPTLPVCGS